MDSVRALQRMATIMAKAHKAVWQATMRIVRHKDSPYINLRITKDKVPSGKLAYKICSAAGLGPFINLTITYRHPIHTSLSPELFACPSNLKPHIQYPLPEYFPQKTIDLYKLAVSSLLKGHFVQLSAKTDATKMVTTGYYILNMGGPGTLKVILNDLSPYDNILVDIDTGHNIIPNVISIDTLTDPTHIEDHIKQLEYLLTGQEPPTIPLCQDRFKWTNNGVRRTARLTYLDPIGLCWTTDNLIMTRGMTNGGKVVFAMEAATDHRCLTIATDGNKYWEVSRCGDVLVVIPPHLTLNPDDVTTIKVLINRVWNK